MAIPKSSLKKRGNVFYLHFFENGVRNRISLQTDSIQTAKDRQRQFDAARARGEQSVLPTKTPLARAVSVYIAHMKTSRTRHGYMADLSYLRSAFGPICDALKRRRRSRNTSQDDVRQWRHARTIEATYLEQITVAQVSDSIREQIHRREIQAKIANRCQEILRRLFSWSMDEGGVRMPGDLNPVAKVKRYKERAPGIRFLNLQQIDQQLEVLQGHPVIRAMVATYVYAGLRREELLWLTREDVDFKTGRAGVIRVRAKTVDGDFWQPKTKVNRIVPISRALRAILDGYIRPTSAGPWFFPSPHGKRWDPDSFSQALRTINRAAGLPWSSLMYCHALGSQLAMKAESLYKTSTLMGNSPDIYRRHYATLMPESLVQSVEFDSEFVDQTSALGPI